MEDESIEGLVAGAFGWTIGMAAQAKSDLESNLPPEIIKSVERARVEARSIIESIEPEHITSWADLKEKLEIALKRVKAEMKLANGC